MTMIINKEAVEAAAIEMGMLNEVTTLLSLSQDAYGSQPILALIGKEEDYVEAISNEVTLFRNGLMLQFDKYEDNDAAQDIIASYYRWGGNLSCACDEFLNPMTEEQEKFEGLVDDINYRLSWIQRGNADEDTYPLALNQINYWVEEANAEVPELLDTVTLFRGGESPESIFWSSCFYVGLFYSCGGFTNWKQVPVWTTTGKAISTTEYLTQNGTTIPTKETKEKAQMMLTADEASPYKALLTHIVEDMGALDGNCENFVSLFNGLPELKVGFSKEEFAEAMVMFIQNNADMVQDGSESSWYIANEGAVEGMLEWIEYIN